MNESQTQTEFVLRRLTESFRLAGRDVNPWVWVAVLTPVLLLGLAYVVWMYRRDARSIAWPWAVLLGALRSAVYILLAIVFLLPAMQMWDRTEKQGRVLLLLDVSPSVATVSDELPPDGGGKSPTRLDRLIDFLSDPRIRFVDRLKEQNIVQAFRFGARLDDESVEFDRTTPDWSAADWSAWLRSDMKAWLLRGVSPAGRTALAATPSWGGDDPGSVGWAAAWVRLSAAETLPATLPEADARILADRRAKLERRLDVLRQLDAGTAVGESLRSLLNREGNSMVQGVVLISDGRSNLGSDSAIAEVRARARKDGIPIFAIQLGDNRDPVSIRVVDVQTPEQAPPNEKFVVRVEVDGEGLAGEEATARLDIIKPEETDAAHSLETRLQFQPGEPPHAQAEFTVDPEQLPADLTVDSSGRRELIEGEWKFVVRIPRDRRELFAEKEHRSDPAAVQVIKKPLRVLLVASGPLKDYQFVRTLLVRERDARRAELSIFLQNDSRDGRGVQDVEPERFLNRFPDTLRVEDDPNEKLEDRYYNLAQYDLIVCFDPDWSEFSAEQLILLQKWVELQAGGLILIAGPINTYQLARDDAAGRLKPLLDLFPVVPGDSVLNDGAVRRNTRQPWRLHFPGANADMEFLKLDDDSRDLLGGWNLFFDGGEPKPGSPPARGFYSVYPLKAVKPGAAVIATLADPAAMLDGREHPFLVVQQFGKGRVAFIGSSELWRLRQYKEVFFERFWIKLGRYMSAGSRTRQNRRGVLVMGRQFVTGQYVRFEAQLFGPSLEPIAKSTKASARILGPESGDRHDVELAPKSGVSEWAGWFQGRWLVSQPGDYTLELPIPSSSDVLRGKFVVRASNPELDATRPDPAALRALAGDVSEIQSRIRDRGKLEDLRGRLRAGRSTDGEPVTEAPKLMFTLASADVIPECLPAVPPQVSRSRGAVDDLWDDGPALGSTADGKPRTIAWLLLVLVGLLSTEWLLRKLLRLA